MNWRQVATVLTPPAVASELRRARRWLSHHRDGQAAAPAWEVVPEGWRYADAHPEVAGWNVASVLRTQLARWPRFVAMVEGNEPLGFSHESDLSYRLDLASHNAIMSFAYALALAARGRDRVSFLDWGGGLGHFLVLGCRLLPEIQIEYHCRELPLLAEQGARIFPDQHFTADDACLERKYDLVMASTSLQYEEDWRALLARLGGATGEILYVTGLPVVVHAPSFMFVQRPHEFGYDTEYLAWCLNRDEFIAETEANGLRLMRELVVGHRPPIAGAAEQAEYRGFLFRPCSKEGEPR
ncbi:MAG: hypothetical protein ACHQQS_00390 [Thermoanaerobaculales bacterium]